MDPIRSRVSLALWGAALGTLALTALAAEPTPKRAPRALVVSVDGLMPDDYLRADELGLKVPTLRRLMRTGAYARVVGVLPTVTYPSHTTLVTGVPPRVHGIVANTVFDPFDRSEEAWYWFARDVRVPTLISAARARWLSTASLSWPVSIGDGADFNVPEFWRLGSTHPVDLQLLDALSTPRLLDGVAAWRARPLDWPLGDDDRVDAALYLLHTQRPALVLLHLVEVDFARHDHGPRAPEALAAVEQADARLGRLLEALDETGAAGDTLVAVVSDHGFLPVTHELRPNALLRQAGLMRFDAQGRVESWRAYFRASGGSAALYLRDPADLDALRQARALFEARLREPDSPLRALLEPERIAVLGGAAEAAFVLDARAGFYFAAGAAGEWRSPSAKRGTHGYSPEQPEMQAGFVLSAPGLRTRGDLGVIGMTAIAPTVARFLGIELSAQAAPPLSLFD